MRERSQSTIVASSDVNWTRADGLTGTWTNANPSYYGYVSKISDISDKQKHAFKPCIHMSYNAEVSPFATVDDNSGDPSQWITYPGRQGFHYGQHLPPLLSGAENYISVTPQTTDDIGDCVFRAYNTYINSYRALDASQSIAELGETPHLFKLWQRRRGLASNLVNGFLNYSFGWKPVINDLRAISQELRRFPSSVRKRLHRIGQGKVTRHFSFDYSSSIQSPSAVYSQGGTIPNPGSYYRSYDTDVSKSRRKVIVTIRAKVGPKLQGTGQDVLNKLGTLGLIPSLATVWAVTSRSFMIDWFYNIGGAIENLQGSLTHDISDVEICVTDTRERELRYLFDTGPSHRVAEVGREKQRCFLRSIPSTVSLYVPQLRLPRSTMQYVLLGLVALSGTDSGQKLLRTPDRYTNPLDRRLDRIEASARKWLMTRKPVGR